jgi:hypothetical protein
MTAGELRLTAVKILVFLSALAALLAMRSIPQLPEMVASEDLGITLRYPESWQARKLGVTALEAAEMRADFSAGYPTRRAPSRGLHVVLERVAWADFDVILNAYPEPQSIAGSSDFERIVARAATYAGLDPQAAKRSTRRTRLAGRHALEMWHQAGDGSRAVVVAQGVDLIMLYLYVPPGRDPEETRRVWRSMIRRVRITRRSAVDEILVPKIRYLERTHAAIPNLQPLTADS